MLCPYYLLYVLCFILPLDHEIGYVAFACFQVFDSSQRFSWPSTENRQEVHENLEKVPRIWEGEGARRSEILNPINNDDWVLLHPFRHATESLLSFLGRAAGRHLTPPCVWSATRDRGSIAIEAAVPCALPSSRY